ncbi:hypothetical protein AURDEDRAFT_186468 [Auricularia subglabra TFB-10046 SS5]|nr:hypothetical protein AURDEDRAFT_186468 [Auricularia subglabra TFB-10046 SS5]
MSAPTNTAAPAAAARAPRAIAGRTVLKRQYAFYDVRDAGLEPLPKPKATRGAWNDGAAANAQTSSAADVQQPSFMAAVISFAVSVFRGPAKRKYENDDEPRDAKRRRVEPDAQPQSRAEGRQTAGKPASNTTTGATASTYQNSTAAAGPSAVRDAPKTPVKPFRPGKGPVIRRISSIPDLRELGRPLHTVPKLSPSLLADINTAHKANRACRLQSGQPGFAVAAGSAPPPLRVAVRQPSVFGPMPRTPPRVLGPRPAGLPPPLKYRRGTRAGALKRKAQSGGAGKDEKTEKDDAATA